MSVKVSNSADELLERIFQIIVEEARSRPEFAEKLINAIAHTNPISKVDQKKQKPIFDPNSFSLITEMKTEGKEGLIKRLNKIRSRQILKQLAEAQNVPIREEVFSDRNIQLAQIRQLIIEGVQKRINDRLAAASLKNR